MEHLPILTLLLFSPLIGVLIIAFLPKDRASWIRWTAVAATFLPLALGAYVFTRFNASSSVVQFSERYSWLKIPLNQEARRQFESYSFNFEYTLGLDGISLPLVLMTVVIAFVAALASYQIQKRWKAYYIWFLLLEVGMLGVFMARDLFLFFVFFELTLIPMFFLIGIWGFMNREKAANQFLIYNGLGSAAMLIGFLMLIVTAGFTSDIIETTGEQSVNAVYYTANLSTISENLRNPDYMIHYGGANNAFFLSEASKWTAFILLLLAFAVKLPVFPFHTWMLRVHREAPPAVVMIHAGILLKLGGYGMIQFAIMLFPDFALQASLVLALFGLVNVLYGALLAMVQTDLRLILAYASVSHMGLVLIGLAAFNVIGWQGAVFQLVSHGLISALMFLIIGSLLERTGTTDIREMSGLAAKAPFLCGMFMVGGLALLGLPALSGFVAELQALLGLFNVFPVITVLAGFGLIFAAVYVLRGIMQISFGHLTERLNAIRDARFMEAFPMMTLVAFIVLLGVYPNVLNDTMDATIRMLLNIVRLAGG